MEQPGCVFLSEAILPEDDRLSQDPWLTDFRLTSWKVCWSLAITKRLSPISNQWKRVIYPGEEKVAILRAHFVEGLLQPHVQLKKPWGSLSRRWGPVPHDTRDQIVDSVNRWTVHAARSHARAKVSFSHSPRMSTGTSMSLTSTSPARSYSWRSSANTS